MLAMRKTGLYHDSRQVRPGGVYFALRDNKYVDEAIANGAEIIVSKTEVYSDKVKCIVADDPREYMALEAKKFYRDSADKMRITAVAGTNGKTTSAHMVRHILETATGKNVGLIGTTGVIGAGSEWDGISTLTTPDPIDLHRAIYAMYKNGIRDVVMEVSAHAIHYKKIAGINFDGVIFTNITQDHLDFFESFEQYKDTKISFFEKANIGFSVVNADDKYANDIVTVSKRSVAFSLEKNMPDADKWVFVRNVVSNTDGCDFEIDGAGDFHIPICGRFNVSNAVGAALLCRNYGIEWPAVKEALRTLPQVPGRFNTYRIKGVTVIVDYAHTPDGLEKLLLNARGLLSSPEAKLFCVFGCGGDRDKSKRPKMGGISYRLADFTVLTGDNPRTENPDVIIDEIERGIKTSTVEAVTDDLTCENRIKYVRITDRTAAIEYAVGVAKARDIVVIAGKGHENYMDIGGIKIPYSDVKVLDNMMMKENKGTYFDVKRQHSDAKG
jgi:UDP-N-acetylmuramoyl-L-alanyl-D-glutamate--2,6-diaminopimelate ligase